MHVANEVRLQETWRSCCGSCVWVNPELDTSQLGVWFEEVGVVDVDGFPARAKPVVPPLEDDHAHPDDHQDQRNGYRHRNRSAHDDGQIAVTASSTVLSSQKHADVCGCDG